MEGKSEKNVRMLNLPCIKWIKSAELLDSTYAASVFEIGPLPLTGEAKLWLQYEVPTRMESTITGTEGADN